MLKILALLSTLAFLAAPNALAQPHDAHQHHAAPAANTLATGQGIVKKIDPEKLRLTLAHDPIAKLGWPAMTMPFAVTDKALLQNLKINDVVRFELQDEQTIVAVEVVTGK
ncbi:MAG: copper-binding protein [Zoogloeaceae bacterium]|nr:copper-binding protein [Zoogloeaceae bacterium]